MAKSPFTRKVIEIIQSIPPGKVTTYGIIALHANNHRAARQVARILHSSSRKHNLPWHRVVNKEAKISLRPGNGFELQKQMLEAEGIKFARNGRISFAKHLWWPDNSIAARQPEE